MTENICCVCKKSLANPFGVIIIYSEGPDGLFCSQECMRNYMEDTQNAIKWMDWRADGIKMWRWPEFVPEEVRPRCKICNGLLTLCGPDENAIWHCGYCDTRNNLAAQGMTVEQFGEKLKSVFADFYKTGGDPKSFDRLREIYQ